MKPLFTYATAIPVKTKEYALNFTLATVAIVQKGSRAQTVNLELTLVCPGLVCMVAPAFLKTAHFYAIAQPAIPASIANKRSTIVRRQSARTVEDVLMVRLLCLSLFSLSENL